MSVLSLLPLSLIDWLEMARYCTVQLSNPENVRLEVWERLGSYRYHEVTAKESNLPWL